MSPAGVQGASAFKVAALGSHSSPPSPRQVKITRAFLCAPPVYPHSFLEFRLA